MTHKEKLDLWKSKYNRARNMAENIDRMITARCRKLSLEAGLDPNLLGIHPHNAMVSFQDGRPWPEVDYSKVRKILWLQRTKQFQGYELADKIADRYWIMLFRS